MKEFKKYNISENTTEQDSDTSRGIRVVIQKEMILVSAAIAFLLIVFITTLLFFSLIVKDIEMNHEYINDYIIELQVSNLISSKNSLESNLYSELKSVSTSIEYDIQQLENQDEIESKLNKGIIPDEIEQIFKRNISRTKIPVISYNYNNRRDLFIATKEKIVTDYNLSKATTSNIERTWDYEISTQYNSKMATKTVEYLLTQQKDKILVFETGKSKNPKHNYYDELTEETLCEIIKNEGIEGLKSYTFLVPAYITETGDVFGKEDIITGHIQKNNKFILIQEYNLYDYIMKNNLLNTDPYKVIDINLQSSLNLLRVFAITVICAVVCVVLFISVISNKIFYLGDKKDKQQK